MNKLFKLLTLSLVVLMLISSSALAQDSIELRFTCYQDGTECEVYGDLLDRFMADNEGITIVIDQVEYQAILDSLPINVEVGEGPNIARVTNFPQLSDYYLDMRPLMMDPSVLDDAYNPLVLAAFRPGGEGDGLYGFTDALTVTGPFVNATLFEQAGIEIPGEGATWEEWGAVLTEVRDATGVEYGFAIDNRGHRFAGPAMSMGATFFDEEGNFDLAGDEGFSAFAEILKGWLDNGLSPIETWSTGDAYTAANEYFINVQTVMYFSGSWQIGGFANTIGDAFDWVVAPNPTGPGGSTGVAGGAAIVAFDSGDEAVNAATAAVMEYLAQPENVAEFAARTLNISSNSVAIEMGIEYDSDNPQVIAALNSFSNEVGKLQDQAVMLTLHPFNFAYYGAGNTRLQQYFAGEIELADVTERIQADIDEAVANAE